MAITAKISKEKRQSIITLRHEKSVNREISRTFKVSSSAVAKTLKLYDETQVWLCYKQPVDCNENKHDWIKSHLVCVFTSNVSLKIE
jgi:predicted transcriptional regulator